LSGGIDRTALDYTVFKEHQTQTTFRVRDAALLSLFNHSHVSPLHGQNQRTNPAVWEIGDQSYIVGYVKDSATLQGYPIAAFTSFFLDHL
jgi:hypothetical protein